MRNKSGRRYQFAQLNSGWYNSKKQSGVKLKDGGLSSGFFIEFAVMTRNERVHFKPTDN